MGTVSDFAQNCSKYAPVGAMKNPQVSDQNAGGLDFMAFYTLRATTHFCPCGSLCSF